MDCAINPWELEEEYKKNEKLYREKLASFRPKGTKRYERKLTYRQVAPYNIDLFARYFIDTYYAMCQVCVADAGSMIPNWMLVLCIDILDKDINRHFDYASLVAEGLHNALCNFKMGKSSNFKYYSLLMHIFVYKGRRIWHLDLKLKLVIGGEPLSIQEWTYIWNLHLNESNYLVFENLFVRKLLTIPQKNVRWGLIQQVKEFLKPVDIKPKLEIPQNWGSWFYFKDHIIIRVFCSCVAPWIFPITI